MQLSATSGSRTTDLFYINAARFLIAAPSQSIVPHWMNSSTTEFQADRWAHVALVNTGSARLLYLDGVLCGSNSFSVTHFEAHLVYFGRTDAHTTRAGVAFRDMRYYVSSATAADVATMYKPLLHGDMVCMSAVRSESADVRALDADVVQPSAGALTKSLGTYANRWATQYCDTQYCDALAATTLDVPFAVDSKAALVFSYDGGSTADTSGNGNTLALTEVRQSGTSLVMFWTTARAAVTALAHTASIAGSAYTASFWVYVPTSAFDGSSVGLMQLNVASTSSSDTTSDLVYINSARYLACQPSTTSTATFIMATTGSTFPADRWVHVALVGSSSGRALYVDGALRGSNSNMVTHAAAHLVYFGSTVVHSARAGVAFRDMRYYVASATAADAAALYKPLLHGETVCMSVLRSDNADVRALEADLVQPSVGAVTKALGSYDNQWTTHFCGTLATPTLDAPFALNFKAWLVFAYVGSSALDTSGNGNTLALTSVRQSGGSMVMTANTSRAAVEALAHTTSIAATAYTASLWVYVPASAFDGSNIGLMQLGAASTSNTTDLVYINASRFLSCQPNSTTTSSALINRSTTVFPADRWVHVAFMGSMGDRHLYQDGVTVDASATPVLHAAAHLVYFGSTALHPTRAGVAFRNMRYYATNMGGDDVTVELYRTQSSIAVNCPLVLSSGVSISSSLHVANGEATLQDVNVDKTLTVSGNTTLLGSLRVGAIADLASEIGTLDRVVAEHTAFNLTVPDLILDAVGLGPVVNITGVVASDSWLVQTDNTGDAFQVAITPAFDHADISNVAAKPNPIFTSNTTIFADTNWADANGWVVAASSIYEGGREAFNAFDSSDTTAWWSGNAVFNTSGYGNQWLQLEYLAPVALKTFSMKRCPDPRNQLIEWTMQGSNASAGPFTDIESYALSNWAPVETFQVSTAHEPYRYWRMKMTRKMPDANANFGVVILPNVQFFTGWSTGRITLTSVLPVSVSDFKLVLSDTDGRPIIMLNSPLDWTFNIVIFKQRAIVNSGLYRFGQVGGVGTVTKLN
ncbi:hypothetical protein T492DRAFT_832131 [Pavlovales sp. CCMP2436]|nr:hypothetical protein T492DRAFT_832131 [Pavlovales sp. CCMP2436]